MHSRILVPLDGSKLAEQVLPYVDFLARKFASRVEVLQVVSASNNETNRRINVAWDYVRRIENVLEKDGLLVDSKVVVGNASEQIILEAKTDPSTLVAMSNRGHGGLEPGILGGVVEGVLGGTTNPLLIIRSQPEESFSLDVEIETLIVPLDGSSLAESVLPYVVPLSQVAGLAIILVRANPIAGGQEHLIEYSDTALDNNPVDIDSRAKEYLHSIGQSLRNQGVAQVQEQLLHGDPAVAIVEFAQQVPNNLVAMTTHGSSGAGPWPLGSVTQLVECHCCTPVLVVRPDHESPA